METIGSIHCRRGTHFFSVPFSYEIEAVELALTTGVSKHHCGGTETEKNSLSYEVKDKVVQCKVEVESTTAEVRYKVMGHI